MRAFIALGSNLGNRAKNISTALDLLQQYSKHTNCYLTNKNLPCKLTIQATSQLYETLPMYELQQQNFYNACCLLETDLTPEQLLLCLQQVEREVGRVPSFRNGPRAIDLDILFMENYEVQSEKLQIPHPRIHERAFVLQPLYDIDPSLNIQGQTVDALIQKLPQEDLKSMRRVIPLTESRSLEFPMSTNNRFPKIAGIVNMTPDSFSDGGKYSRSINIAMDHVHELLEAQCDILDIGGESTRPGSKVVSVEEELERVIPIIQEIRRVNTSTAISIDTRNSIVALEAIKAGADIINDVSGGKHDSKMLQSAKNSQVPIILMHIRGTPQTMTQPESSHYEDITQEVIQELHTQCSEADKIGIPRWHQIIDPGIGFAKNSIADNMTLLSHASISEMQYNLRNRAMMLGVSRKRFIAGSMSLGFDQQDMRNRDMATIGCCSYIASHSDVEIYRVHDAKSAKLALQLVHHMKQFNNSKVVK